MPWDDKPCFVVHGHFEKGSNNFCWKAFAPSHVLLTKIPFFDTEICSKQERRLLNQSSWSTNGADSTSMPKHNQVINYLCLSFNYSTQSWIKTTIVKFMNHVMSVARLQNPTIDKKFKYHVTSSTTPIRHKLRPQSYRRWIVQDVLTDLIRPSGSITRTVSNIYLHQTKAWIWVLPL